jgi:hypothetical protein
MYPSDDVANIFLKPCMDMATFWDHHWLSWVPGPSSLYINSPTSSCSVLDSKFIIFRDCCQKVGIGAAYMNKAFSLMLDGKAREYYYRRIIADGNDETLPLDRMISMLKAQVSGTAIRVPGSVFTTPILRHHRRRRH